MVARVDVGVVVVEVEARGGHKVLVGDVVITDRVGDDREDACGKRGFVHRDRLVEIKVALHLLAGEVPGEQEHREDEIGLLGHLMSVDDDRMVLVEQGELGEGGVFDIPPLFREETVVLRIDTARFVVGDIGIVDRALPFGGLFVREVDLLRQSSVLVGHLFL